MTFAYDRIVDAGVFESIKDNGGSIEVFKVLRIENGRLVSPFQPHYDWKEGRNVSSRHEKGRVQSSVTKGLHVFVTRQGAEESKTNNEFSLKGCVVVPVIAKKDDFVAGGYWGKSRIQGAVFTEVFLTKGAMKKAGIIFYETANDFDGETVTHKGVKLSVGMYITLDYFRNDDRSWVGDIFEIKDIKASDEYHRKRGAKWDIIIDDRSMFSWSKRNPLAFAIVKNEREYSVTHRGGVAIGLEDSVCVHPLSHTTIETLCLPHDDEGLKHGNYDITHINNSGWEIGDILERPRQRHDSENQRFHVLAVDGKWMAVLHLTGNFSGNIVSLKSMDQDASHGLISDASKIGSVPPEFELVKKAVPKDPNKR